MDRTQKKEWIGALHETFGDAGLVVVTHYKGLTVAEMTDLRTKMRAAGASFKVTKNRLTKLALQGTARRYCRSVRRPDRYCHLG